MGVVVVDQSAWELKFRGNRSIASGYGTSIGYISVLLGTCTGIVPGTYGYSRHNTGLRVKNKINLPVCIY